MSTKWTDADLVNLAQAWIDEGEGDGSAGGQVVLMNFAAPHERQWFFICAAVERALTDDDFAKIAAGPLEHLLGFHGERYISDIEKRCEVDPRFRRAISGVWRHKMSAELWARVQRLQAGAVS